MAFTKDWERSCSLTLPDYVVCDDPPNWEDYKTVYHGMLEPSNGDIVALSDPIIDTNDGTITVRAYDPQTSIKVSELYAYLKELAGETNATTNTNETKEDLPMLTIKHTVLIDGTEYTDYSAAELISMIQDEESSIAELEGINAESTAIKKLIDTHSSNITELVKLLDKLEE